VVEKDRRNHAGPSGKLTTKEKLGAHMPKKVILVTKVSAVGPYSQAVEAGGFLFCSGQIPLDPQTGTIVGGDIGNATRQAMANLETVLGEAGLAMKDVVKTTIYLIDLNDFPIVNEIYGTCFDGQYPARATVQVAGLPKGALIEIDAVAVRP
jgi:2-iminobutanoate/2-iminopropanoate deaminase